MKKQLFGIVLIALFVAGCAEVQTTGSTASVEKTVRAQPLKPHTKIILEKGLESENARLRMMATEEAFEIVELWLATDYEGGRHQKRVDKIEFCN